MIFSLVKKDLRGRYKGSVLGFLWTFINPLLQLVVFTLVFSVIMKAGYEQYYMFLFVALVPWMFFASSVQDGSTSILREKDMVKKIYFPREVLPIATVTSGFVNMLLTFIGTACQRKKSAVSGTCLPSGRYDCRIHTVSWHCINCCIPDRVSAWFTVYSRYFSDGVTVYDTGDVRKRYGSGLGNADFQTQSDDTGDRNLSWYFILRQCAADVIFTACTIYRYCIYYCRRIVI